MDLTLIVPGLQLPKGTKAWISIKREDVVAYDDEVKVYKSKEHLAQRFIERNYLDFLSELNYHYYGYFPNTSVPLDTFQKLSREEQNEVIANDIAVLKRIGVTVVPFTRENLFQHLLTSDMFVLYMKDEQGDGGEDEEDHHELPPEWTFHGITF